MRRTRTTEGPPRAARRWPIAAALALMLASFSGCAVRQGVLVPTREGAGPARDLLDVSDVVQARDAASKQAAVHGPSVDRAVARTASPEPRQLPAPTPAPGLPPPEYTPGQIPGSTGRMAAPAPGAGRLHGLSTGTMPGAVAGGSPARSHAPRPVDVRSVHPRGARPGRRAAGSALRDDPRALEHGVVPDAAALGTRGRDSTVDPRFQPALPDRPPDRSAAGRRPEPGDRRGEDRDHGRVGAAARGVQHPHAVAQRRLELSRPRRQPPAIDRADPQRVAAGRRRRRGRADDLGRVDLDPRREPLRGADRRDLQPARRPSDAHRHAVQRRGDREQRAARGVAALPRIARRPGRAAAVAAVGERGGRRCEDRHRLLPRGPGPQGRRRPRRHRAAAIPGRDHRGRGGRRARLGTAVGPAQP